MAQLLFCPINICCLQFVISTSKWVSHNAWCGVLHPARFMPPTYVPLMTPSGLSMGMSLKTKASLRLWATGSLLHRNSRVPFIIQLALDSPGWTRPVSTIQGRFPRQRQTETWCTVCFRILLSNSHLWNSSNKTLCKLSGTLSFTVELCYYYYYLCSQSARHQSIIQIRSLIKAVLMVFPLHAS